MLKKKEGEGKERVRKEEKERHEKRDLNQISITKQWSLLNLLAEFGGWGSLHYFLYFCKYLKSFIANNFFKKREKNYGIDPCVLKNPLENYFI